MESSSITSRQLQGFLSVHPYNTSIIRRPRTSSGRQKNVLHWSLLLTGIIRKMLTELKLTCIIYFLSLSFFLVRNIRELASQALHNLTPSDPEYMAKTGMLSIIEPFQ